MRKLVVLSLPLAACVALAVPAFGATTSIKMGDNFFKPTKVTVKKGTYRIVCVVHPAMKMTSTVR